MVDLILAVFTVGTFFLGYWVGRTHQPRSVLFARFTAWLRSLFT